MDFFNDCGSCIFSCVHFMDRVGLHFIFMFVIRSVSGCSFLQVGSYLSLFVQKIPLLLCQGSLTIFVGLLVSL